MVSQRFCTLAGTLSLLASTTLLAQPGAGAPSTYQGAPAQYTPPPDTERASALAAIAGQQLARAVLLDLRFSEDPTPADARLAARMLSDASALDKGNPTIVRMAIDAATMAGDQQMVLDLCRSLVQLDPDDTAATLDLIQARIAFCSTVEERLAIFDTVLGPRGDSIDPAVRSRLALQAAVMRRERGDAEGFTKALTLATTLDPSNYSAAETALEYFSVKVKDPAARFEMLANTLLAAPLDPTVHAAVAHELAAAGAVEQSVRFFENAKMLYARRGRFLPLDQNAEYLVQSWKAQGPEQVVKPLSDAVDTERRKAQQDIDVANATGKPIDKLPTPTSFRQPVQLERIRFAASFAAGDRSTVDRSLADYALSIADLPTNDPVRGAAEAEIAFCKAVADGGDIRSDIPRLRSTVGVTPQAIARLEAWGKFRSGNRAGAMSDIAAMKTDPLAAFSLAVMETDGGAGPASSTPEGRALDDRLAALAYTDAASPISAWAYTKYKNRNDGKAPPPPERAQKFAAMGAGIPSWLDDGARDTTKVVSIKVDPPRSGGLAPLDPAMVTFRVRNNTPVPLAVGPNMTVDSRLLITPSVDIGGQHMLDTPQPEVGSLAGRLRIMPHEEVTFRVWAEPGITGWAVQNRLVKTARLRLTIMQGYVIENTPKPGPFGNTIETAPISRTSVPLGDPSRLVTELATLRDDEFALAVLHARLQLNPRERPLSVEQAKALVTVLGDRYRRAGSAERIVILTLTPTPRLCGAAIDLERVVSQVDETDPAVMRAALLTRVDDPASPLLAKYRSSPDKSVQDAVKVIETRLGNEQRQMFSKIVFNVQSSLPPPPREGKGAKPGAALPPVAPTPPAGQQGEPGSDKPTAPPGGTPPADPAAPSPTTPAPLPPSNPAPSMPPATPKK